MEGLADEARRVLEQMPVDQPPRGARPRWGDVRRDAYRVVAKAGHRVNERCQSCDADVYDILKELAR